MTLQTPPGLLFVCTAPDPWQPSPFSRRLVVQWAKGWTRGQPGLTGVQSPLTRPAARGPAKCPQAPRATSYRPPRNPGHRFVPRGGPFQKGDGLQRWGSQKATWHLLWGSVYLSYHASGHKFASWSFCPLALVARLPWHQFCTGSSSVKTCSVFVQGPWECLPVDRG